MKKNKFFTAIILVVLAVAFVGCYNPTNLQETKNKVLDLNTKTIVSGKLNSLGEIKLTNTNLVADSKNSTFEIKITSRLPIDIDIETINAFRVFELSNPTGSETYYVEGKTLAFKIISIKKSFSSSMTNMYTTNLYCSIDLTGYKKSRVGFRADATILKDINGNFILNNYTNAIFGEKEDGYQNTMTVTSASETINLGGAIIKPLCDANPIYQDINYQSELATQEYYFTVPGLVKQTAGGTVFYEGDASDLATIFELETLAPGATEWVKSSLSFTWDSVTNEYRTSKTKIPVAGTMYRVIRTDKPNFERVCNGCISKMTLKDYETKTVASTGTWEYYSENTPYITSMNSETVAFQAPLDGVRILQNRFLNKTGPFPSKGNFGAVITFECNNTTVASEDDDYFASTDGFKVTTTEELGLINVPFTLKEIKNKDGKTKQVVITVDETYKCDDLLFWVGEGTTLAKNETNPKQLKFGLPKDASKGIVSGYTQL